MMKQLTFSKHDKLSANYDAAPVCQLETFWLRCNQFEAY